VTTDDMQMRIQKVFGDVFGRRVPFSPSLSRLNEPSWSSLKHVEFIVGLEREFGVRFDGADATDMTSISAVATRLWERLKSEPR